MLVSLVCPHARLLVGVSPDARHVSIMHFKISSAVESVGDAVCGRRKFNTIYIDHTEGSKKANSGWEKLRRFPNIIFFMVGSSGTH